MEKKFPVRNPDIVARRDKDEALLFDPASGRMLCVNGTGIMVWDLCEGTHDRDSIAAKIVDEFDVTIDKALSDVDLFLDDMEKAGFVGYRT